MKLKGAARKAVMRSRGVVGAGDPNDFRCVRHPEKRRYADKHLARREAKRLAREHGTPMHVYRCPACGDHHLTKSARRS